MKTLLKEWFTIIIGLLIFSLGVHMTIIANIGLAPWDCLGMGMSYHTPFNYGTSMTIISCIILVLDIGMKEKIGFGTIIDALCTGQFIQLFNTFDPIPYSQSLPLSIIYMIIGLFLMAIGQYFYMKVGQGCGPRDSFLIGIGKRLSFLSVGVVEMIIFITVLLLGYLLGGPIGIGTIISTLGAGICMHITFHIIHFEPRDIQQRDVFETLGEK